MYKVSGQCTAQTPHPTTLRCTQHAGLQHETRRRAVHMPQCHCCCPVQVCLDVDGRELGSAKILKRSTTTTFRGFLKAAGAASDAAAASKPFLPRKTSPLLPWLATRQ